MTKPCIVYITNTLTGETRQHKDEWWDDEEWPDYIWADGNFSCDCNRALFFARALGEPDPKDRGCSNGKYIIDKIILEDGTIVYSEKEQPDFFKEENK